MPINVTMPALSPTMTEGNLAKWHKKEGDKIKAGDVIAEIETDKATMEVEAVDEGILGKILVPEGTPAVKVNTAIAILLEEGEKFDPKMVQTANDPKPSTSSASAAPKQETKHAPSPPVHQTQHQPINRSPNQRIFASPLARRLAAERGLSLRNFIGTGPGGRIIKADLEKTATPATTAPAAPSMPQGPDPKKIADAYGMKYTLKPNNNIKKIVAKRLQESKQLVPHFYLTIECKLDKLLALRSELNKKHEKDGIKISVNDFVIKAAALALRDYPAANTSWTDDAVLQYTQADVSVAVSTSNGLITPIIKNAEGKNLTKISTEMKDLAARARDNKLKPEEFTGGSFTVSNLGMFGIKEFGAIINPPQSCILAVGAGVETPVVEDGKVVIRTLMTCTLSVDHRSVDGTVGAEYLQVFKKYVENPDTMIK